VDNDALDALLDPRARRRVRLVLDGTHVVTAPAIAGGPKPPYANPLLAQDCPDPRVIAIGTPPVYYAICTGGRFPIRRSHDLVMWETTGAFVFPSGKPPYTENGNRNWAPEMHEVGGKFLGQRGERAVDRRCERARTNGAVHVIDRFKYLKVSLSIVLVGSA
jgi:Glycosyl hydrolases family 43